MPNIKSAKKRLRSALAERVVNLPRKARVRSCRRAFLEAVETGDKDVGTKAFSEFCSSLDKAAKFGTMKKNTAIRCKSRAAAQLQSLIPG